MRPRILAVAAAVVISLTACTSSPGPAESSRAAQDLDEKAQSALAPLPGVDVVELSTGATTSLVVTMEADASSDDTVSVAAAERAFVDANEAPQWTASLSAGGIDDRTDLDMTSVPAISITVFPATGDLATVVEGALAAQMIPGVESVGYVQDTNSVDVGDVADLPAVYDALHEIPFWDRGGSITGGIDRALVVDVPARISATAMHTILGIVTDYPESNLSVSATTSGDQLPVLYVDHLTVADAATLFDTLTAPGMADANIGDYVLPFYLTSYDETGNTDTYGTLGGVAS
jgi:hypothetical protein